MSLTDAVPSVTAPLIAFTLSLLIPTSSYAHPLVERGRRLYEQADFEGALEALEEAEEATDLLRTDLLELLELRALVGLALEDEPLTDRSLRELAALEGEHAFRPEVPPPVVERFRALSVEPLRLRAWARREGSEVVIRGAVQGGESSGLVRRVVVNGRAEQGRWSRVSDEPLHLPSDEGAVDWYVQVVGPGGAVILSQGSAEAPERLEPEERRRRVRPWVWGVVGGAVVVIVGVVLAASLASGGDDEVPTTIYGPYVGE